MAQRRSRFIVCLLCVLTVGGLTWPAPPPSLAASPDSDPPAMHGVAVLAGLSGVPLVPINRTFAAFAQGFGSGGQERRIAIFNYILGELVLVTRETTTKLNTASGAPGSSGTPKRSNYVFSTVTGAVGPLRPNTTVADIVVAVPGSNEYWVLLNRGDDTFPTSVTGMHFFVSGAIITAVTIGDVTGDGNPDLLFSDLGNNAVIVLPGHGDGTFGTPVSYGLGATNLAPADVATADLNGDGRMDVVTANIGPNQDCSGSVSVLLNKGSGGLGSATTYSSGITATSTQDCQARVRLGDLNGDNRPDVVTALTISNASQVAVLLNTGTGVFAAATDYQVGASPIDFALGDVNGDNRPEIAVANNGDSTVSVLRNNGSGTFAPQVTYPVGSNPLAVTLADATLDSKPDILAFGHNSTITVLPGKGNGTFLFLDYPVGKNLRDGLAVDITGDHKPDLIAADDNDGTNGLLDVLLNDGSGGFAPAAGSPIILPGVPQALAAADFTGDSKTDLAVSAFDGNTFTMTVRVLTGNGTGGFTAGAPLPLSANISPGPVLGTADLGNGHPDLVVGETVFNSSAGALDILFDDGHGSFTLKTPIALSAAPQALAIADLGNGHADLAVSLADGTVALFRGDGNGGFTAVGSPITVGTNAGSVALADVNGDNTADLIVASASSDSSLDTASVRLGNGDGTFRAPVALPADPNVPVMRFDDVTYHDTLVVADLNLDGVPDIAVLNACSSECPNVSLYHGNGDGTFTVAATYEVGWAGRTHIIRAADLDGDGHTDLATVGQNGSISVSGGMMGVLRNATIPASAATHLVFAASPPPPSPRASRSPSRLPPRTPAATSSTASPDRSR